MARYLPLLALVLGAGYLAAGLFEPKPASAFDLAAFGRLPVLVNGRVKPLDTVARTSLLVLQGRQRVSDPTVPEPFVASPIEWLADMLFAPGKADDFPTFRISNSDSPELVALMGLTDDDVRIRYDDPASRALAVADFLPGTRTRFSFNKIRAKLPDLEQQARLAESVDSKLRTPFQQAAVQLEERVVLYRQLQASVQLAEAPDFLSELVAFDRAMPAGIAAILAKQKGEDHSEEAVAAMKAMADRFVYLEQMGYLRAIPPEATDRDASHWRTAGTALMDSFGAGTVSPSVMAYAILGHAWRGGDPAHFNEIVGVMRSGLTPRFATALHKCEVEARFNAADPLYRCIVVYAAAFFLGIFSWLKWPGVLGRSAFYLVLVAYAAAASGIITRMWLEGRPPVTNLYSSALFVGFIAVGLCLILERTFRNAIGSVAAGMIGFITLLIAYHLSLAGDTLEMMRAVLDTNLWLATHVVIVTSGYGATFLAGFLALIYIVLGVFTPWLQLVPAGPGALPAAGTPGRSETNGDMLARMVYGIVCFATLCSLVGTVLGGIWADQSWGRFWGWDPKENGALIIVIWNAIFLHARWGRLLQPRGLMCLAVFGNVVTSWSWFGTNMLGVGLHSYGFMDAAFYWLTAFVASQLLLIALALLPLEKWRSFRAQPVAA